MSTSETTPPRPFSGRRFWWWYALAWLDLAGLYFVVFLITGGGESIPKAFAGAFVYVIPMAVLGVGALAVFRRLDWDTGRRAPLVLTHVALGLVYGVAATALNTAMFAGLHWVQPDVFRPVQFNIVFFTWESVMGVLVYGVLAGVCYAILLHQRLREQEARAAQAMALQTKAELRALRAQLNPHFLFNTLHSLLALVRHDPRAAEEALEQFGDLLRYTLDTQKNGEVVPLGDELTFVDNYLALESLRLGDRLQLDIEIDDAARDRRVPAFCLQPLVENAVRHAIAPRAAGGRLTMRVALEPGDGTLRLEVADDGPGAKQADLERDEGLGWKLVRERLSAHYGSGAALDVDTSPGGGFRAVIRLPAGGAKS